MTSALLRFPGDRLATFTSSFGANDFSGLRVLGWAWRDSLPEGRVHARLPSTEAAAALSLPVFRAMAELALLLPA